MIQCEISRNTYRFDKSEQVMGQKVRPTGFRVGIMEDWRSRWYASKKEFGELLVEDFKIRKFIKTKYQFSGIPKIEIERTRDQVVVHLFTARPGIIIGRKGQEVDRLKAELEDLTGRRMELKIVEVNNPQQSAVLVAEDVAQQLVKRGSFRRTIKRTLDQVIDSGALGIKIELSGRLGGAEMSRQEKASRGSIPLSTLRKHIDYGFAVAQTAQGSIGVKVWIDLGEYSDEEKTDGAHAKTGEAPQKSKRTHKR
ncbi:MAG: 30S ribosomal protein S3 [Planctomycetaceae bacterium]